MNVRDIEIGTLIETDKVICLLGNRNSTVENIRKLFPQLKLARIKQVHGDDIVESSSADTEFKNTADAHFTKEPGLALLISTADCIPVFIYDHSLQIVAGIHAGWRGVANMITTKTLEKIGSKNPEIIIGPHILHKSFEVQEDVLRQLIGTLGKHEDLSKHIDHYYTTHESKKFKVDLLKILQQHLLNHQISLENSFIELKDTFSDLNYHSFRRDKEKSGRQLSFIFMK